MARALPTVWRARRRNSCVERAVPSRSVPWVLNISGSRRNSDTIFIGRMGNVMVWTYTMS